MLEALLLAVLIVSTRLLPAWLELFVLMLFLPTAYAMLSGAPFVPTPGRLVRSMVELARVKRGERVYDVGCGDGRFLIAAAKHGAVAIGYELSLSVYLLSRLRTLFADHVSVRLRNFWVQDYREADVIFCFLTVEAMARFYERIWPQLKPGCRVVSHAFRMPGLKATREVEGAVMYVKGGTD